MADTLYKLQPDRTMYLRGFSDLGAGAAIHDATPTGFQVSGVFRDPADFAVVVLWDADDFFNHPTLKYLPDTNFAGLTLEQIAASLGISARTADRDLAYAKAWLGREILRLRG